MVLSRNELRWFESKHRHIYIYIYQDLQPDFKIDIPLLECRCLLLSPAMRSNAGMANRRGDVDLCETLGLACLDTTLIYTQSK